MVKIPTTQRAYTLRLRGATKEDDSWRDALWATHDAVNKGAKAFGDWLLTLRGGLDHMLVNEPVAQPKKDKKEQPPRPPTDEEKRDRRVVLALSWLSVESRLGAPEKNRIEPGKTVDALREILKLRGASEAEIQDWVEDCTRSLLARIRDDACWVNRCNAFEDFCAGCDKSCAREDARKVLWHVLGKDYLTLPRKYEKKTAQANTDVNDFEAEELAEEKRSAAIQSGKGAGQRTRHLFSHIFGIKAESKGFGKQSTMQLHEWWRQQLTVKICECGIPLAQGKEKKSKVRRSPSELHREMLSKAAARLAQIHTKQKQQEVERQARESADTELQEVENDCEFEVALDRLEQVFTNRAPRLRQIDQWDRVVREWAKITESDRIKAAQMREDAAKQLQDELQDEKFGDINLFIALAGDSFKPVWWHNCKANSSILRTYVKGRKARADAERLKVASYRHPDPFKSPVFCQFGVSRPHIDYARLSPIKSKLEVAKDIRAVELLLWDGRQAAHQILFGASKRLDREIGSACDTAAKTFVKIPTVSRRSRLGMSELGRSDNHKVRVAAIFDQKEIRSRKTNEVNDGDEPTLKEASWNGTLQPDRKTLAAIAQLVEMNEHERAAHRLKGLHWSLIVSLGLKPFGPWQRFAGDNFQTIELDDVVALTPKKSKETWRGTAYPFIHLHNIDRCGTMSYHLLSRLPGLRLLSVDLGHRYAAACAVWEAITRAQMIDGCRAANRPEPESSNLYIHLARETDKLQKSGRKRGQRVTEKVIYRRIGNDTLPDGSEHPAPWARLDRQFLIKLQGEEKPARWASDEERDRVNRLALELGYQRPKPRRASDRRVDELMSEAVRIVRLALRRHSDYARIAFRLTYKEMKREAGALEKLPHDDQLDHLSDVLMLWYDLAMSVRWLDDWSLDLWNSAILPRIQSAPFTEPPPLEREDANDAKKVKQRDERMSRWRNIWATLQNQLVRSSIEQEEQEERADRKLNREAVRALLAPVAESLRDDAETLANLSEKWTSRWHEKDSAWAERLKDLRKWLLPRGLRRGRPITAEHLSRLSETARRHLAKRWKVVFEQHLEVLLNAINEAIDRHNKQLPGRKGVAKHVGGLSLTRIATIRSLWQIYKAFRYRPKPDNTRAGTELIEADSKKGWKFGDRMLQAMERMREQRVKQLASRIVEAALGIGSENKWKHWEEGKKRPRSRIAEDGYKPCHAVVIENLTNYRPEETRTRRENRQLMTWSASKVKKYLSEGCQLHGLHLREVSAAYTSRQDSRTGLPGIRCADVTVREFLDTHWWRKAVKQAKKRVKDGENGSTEDRMLVMLDAKWSERWKTMSDEEKKRCPPLRLPQSSGDLFVSVDGHTLQADLNAAANIGLRALLDPDWEGKWWYIPAERDKEGWRVAANKSCAGAIPLKNWRVASTTDGTFSSHGNPLQMSDDEDVKRAKQAYDNAKLVRDSANKELKAAKARNVPGEVAQAEEGLRIAKGEVKRCKNALSEAKKGASAKEVINLWHNCSSRPLAEREFRPYDAYWNAVRYKVIESLQTRGLQTLENTNGTQ
jgi:IS605 OrfB family transposase